MFLPGHHVLDFALPGTLKVIVYPAAWALADDKQKYFPIWDGAAMQCQNIKSMLRIL